MGKPRLIILCRHAQSVGNCNRTIHQTVPDHRVPLTAHGHTQALDAGDRLASMLLPTDTLQIITSPYTRTRETTQGILSSPALAAHSCAPTIKVYEEPRLREQDFGNFQPCGAEMTRMWHERAAYGHFFYRIPNGESAADAYDRVSGFNESLWRQFAEDSFPSVLVLVTHGLMSRVFLMKWFHYSVEYFEDLRNVDHCEFVVMEQEPSGRYELRTTLRTWSGYSAEQEAGRYTCPPRQAVNKIVPNGDKEWPWAAMRFGGCVNGCNHPRAGGGMVERAASVMEAGRDFGGSRSGCASRDGSDDESGNESEPAKQTNDNGMRKGSVEMLKGSSEPADVVEFIKREQVDAKINGRATPTPAAA